MTITTDEEIRLRAYQFWEKKGRPEGLEKDHCRRASEEVAIARGDARAAAVDSDLGRNPGIGSSAGTTGMDPADTAGKNTFEGDVMNDVTPTRSSSRSSSCYSSIQKSHDQNMFYQGTDFRFSFLHSTVRSCGQRSSRGDSRIISLGRITTPGRTLSLRNADSAHLNISEPRSKQVLKNGDFHRRPIGPNSGPIAFGPNSRVERTFCSAVRSKTS